MMKLPPEIGRRMRALRKARGMTQLQVAEGVGIDPSFYGQVERGTNVPSLKTFLAIAETLDVEPADLLPARKSGKADVLYPNVVARLLSDLSPKRRDLVLNMVRDIVAEFKSRKRR